MRKREEIDGDAAARVDQHHCGNHLSVKHEHEIGNRHLLSADNKSLMVCLCKYYREQRILSTECLIDRLSSRPDNTRQHQTAWLVKFSYSESSPD